MSQLGRKGPRLPPAPTPHPHGPGTFGAWLDSGIGRGRDNRTRQQHPQQQEPYGTQAPPPPYGRQSWPPTGGGGAAYGGSQGAPYGGGQSGNGQGHGGSGHGGGHGEPAYFGDPYHQPPQQDPYANAPGHTQAFSINEDPYGDGNTYQRRPGARPARRTRGCTGSSC